MVIIIVQFVNAQYINHQPHLHGLTPEFGCEHVPLPPAMYLHGVLTRAARLKVDRDGGEAAVLDLNNRVRSSECRRRKRQDFHHPVLSTSILNLYLIVFQNDQKGFSKITLIVNYLGNGRFSNFDPLECDNLLLKTDCSASLFPTGRKGF